MPIDRRRHPRVATDLPAEVLGPGDRGALPARVLNVSVGGVLIRGDAALHGHVVGAPDVFPVEADIRFDLPLGRVHLTGRHIHTRRLSADVFELGFKALRFHDGSAERLDAFVAEQLSRT